MRDPRKLPTVAVAAALLLAGGCGNDTTDGSSVPTAPTTPARETTTSAVDPTTTAPAPTGDLDAVRVRLSTVATLESPTALTARPGHDTLYAAERIGTVRLLRPDGARLAVEPEPVLDLASDVASTEGERGLLGLAFSPDGAHLVVSYTDGGDDGASVLERYAMDGDRPDPTSRIELLRIPQPYANHNGGDVAFGPDGYLYAGFGDGGSQNDPGDRAQDVGELIGKMLRIDVSASTAATPYTVPGDNPLVGLDGARNEIWSLGVRNPWRFSFDTATGDLWIGDVGQNAWEEVDHLPASTGGGRGANLGWPLREAGHDTDKPGPRPADLVEPLVEYSHDDGASITGGLVYRGAALPDLAGAYLFSDFASSALWAVRPDDPRIVTLATEGESLSQPVAFAADADGEVHVVCLSGEIIRIDPA